MRWLAIAVVVVACLTGAATARNAGGGRFTPEWSQTPSSYDCWGNYPPSARGAVTGVVHMCCVPGQDRRLNCRMAFEWPRDRHLGEATMRIARRFRLTQASYEAYRADPDAWLQVAVLWEPIVPAVNRDEFILAIDQRTRGLCAPASDAQARMPDSTDTRPALERVYRCPTMLDRND